MRGLPRCPMSPPSPCRLRLRLPLAPIPAGFRQIDGCTDQPRMREPLGEVAQQFARGRVYLLREQPQIVGIAQSPLKQLMSSLKLAAKGERLDQPEAAEQESSLPRRQAILSLVAADQPIGGQPATAIEGGPAHQLAM